MVLGVEHEARKFDAHLTVGRVKTRRNVTKTYGEPEFVQWV